MSRTQLNTKHALLFHPTGSKKNKKEIHRMSMKTVRKIHVFTTRQRVHLRLYVFHSIRWQFNISDGSLSSIGEWKVRHCFVWSTLMRCRWFISSFPARRVKQMVEKWKKTNKWRRRPSSVGWFMTTKWAVQKHWRRFVFHLTERAARVYQEKYKKKRNRE